MSSLTITINSSSKEKITVAHLRDLRKVPDASIEVLFNNTNYIEIIYLYVLYKLDMYLDEHHYAENIRALYFNTCLDIFPKLTEQQGRFLSQRSFSLDRVFEGVPQEIAVAHQNCLRDVCNYFSGMLSTTPYLNSKMFPKKKTLFMKHNYATMIQSLK